MLGPREQGGLTLFGWVSAVCGEGTLVGYCGFGSSGPRGLGWGCVRPDVDVLPFVFTCRQ